MDNGMFQTQMEYFSDTFQVLSWDVPAHGLSRPYDGFSLQKAARELVNILDIERIDKAHMVGQSMGGYISQIVALEFPDRVASIVAVDSSPIQPSYYSAFDTWLLSITPSLLHLYPYDTLIKTIATQIAVNQQAQDYALKTLRGYTKSEIANIMAAVYSGLQEYKADFYLPHPILIVYGELDRSGKVKAYCQRWAERENRELKVVADAAHNSNMDNPDIFNKILKEFLTKELK
jgi:pimeloyl-ACP methyl ester carboxylesterase